MLLLRSFPSLEALHHLTPIHRLLNQHTNQITTLRHRLQQLQEWHKPGVIPSSRRTQLRKRQLHLFLSKRIS